MQGGQLFLPFLLIFSAFWLSSCSLRSRSLSRSLSCCMRVASAEDCPYGTEGGGSEKGSSKGLASSECEEPKGFFPVVNYMLNK